MTSIKKNLGTGIFFTAINKYSNVFISLLISAVLARLLTPEEFGIVAIIAVFISFFNLLSDFGLGPAIVQDKTFTAEDNSSIFSFSILFGTVLGFLFYLAAPLIADFYNNEQLVNLGRLMSLSIFFNSLRVVPNALLLKKLKFKQLAVVSIVVNIISGGIAIVLAYKGFSYYALIIHSILTGFFIFLAYYYLEPVKISFEIDLSSLRKIIKFSTFQFLFNFINYFARNADNLLIGKYFSTAALGFYDKSYKLMKMPVSNLTHVFTPVLHPVLSRYQNDKDIIYRSYFKITKVLAMIGFPLSIFLFFSASEIITIIYGPQWIQSIPVFKILALTVGIQIILSSSGSIFQATNRTDLLFYAGLIGSILILIGIGYGVFIGKSLNDIGFGLLIAFLLNFFQAFYLLINKSLGKSLLKFLKILIFPSILSTSLVGALFLVQRFPVENVLLSLSLKTFVSVVVFGLLFVLSKNNRKLFQEYVWKIFKNRQKK